MIDVGEKIRYIRETYDGSFYDMSEALKNTGNY